jgi:hypothetical protein
VLPLIVEAFIGSSKRAVTAVVGSTSSVPSGGETAATCGARMSGATTRSKRTSTQ